MLSLNSPQPNDSSDMESERDNDVASTKTDSYIAVPTNADTYSTGYISKPNNDSNNNNNNSSNNRISHKVSVNLQTHPTTTPVAPTPYVVRVLWGALWAIVLLFLGIPVSIFFAIVYAILLPFTTCFKRELRNVCDSILGIVRLGHVCAENMLQLKPMFNTE